MKFFKWGKDGGPESGVWGFWLVEIKPLFSIVLLRFEEDTRESYHTHAFNALTWWLKGAVEELHHKGEAKVWTPSIVPKYTPRSCYHKIVPLKRTWAISIRGPWAKRWKEYNYKTNVETTLSNGRKIEETRRWT